MLKSKAREPSQLRGPKPASLCVSVSVSLCVCVCVWFFMSEVRFEHVLVEVPCNCRGKLSTGLSLGIEWQL